MTDATATAASLDAFLGDPQDPHSPMALDSTLSDDRAAAFPGAAIDALNAWGVQRHYLPRAFGGDLDDVLTPLLLMRNVARRDVTAAVAHGKTILGAMCAWVAADDSSLRMARLVAEGSAVSWGLTEQGRGSDIGASSTTAASDGTGVLIEGHKWPIGNATRGRAITVLARTDDRGGPRSLSLFLVDKAEVEPGTIAYRPRRALHGIRGADISGIEFAGTRIGPASAVGPAGHGLELVLKALQITRTLCTALSLGAGDQALAIALAPVDGRPRLGADDLERDTLAECVADLLIAEATAFAGARQLACAPDEMAVVSALVKVAVPDAVERMFRELAMTIGEPAQLVAHGPWGQFQKAARDNRVVGIFDGNSVVNLNVIINELPNILRDGEADADARIRELAFSVESPGWDLSRLRLVTRRGSGLLAALPGLVDRAADAGLHPDALVAARLLRQDFESTRAAAAAAERSPRPPVSHFAIAERITLHFAAAACLAVHLANRPAGRSAGRSAGHGAGALLWADDLWIRAALTRLAALSGVAGGRRLPDELFDAAAAIAETRAPVSILPRWWEVSA